MTLTKFEKKLTAKLTDRVVSALRDELRTPVGDHLTDVQFAEYGTGAIPLTMSEIIDLHLSSCERCADEMLTRMDAATYWDTPEGLDRIERGKKAILPTFEVLTFSRDNDSAVLLDNHGAAITGNPDERDFVSSLLQICRAIARGAYAGTQSVAAAYPLGVRPGHIEWPTFHGYAVREEDKLSRSAAYAICARDNFRAIVLALPHKERYSLEVLLEASDGNPLTEGTISWSFKDREPMHTLRVPTGEALITTTRNGTVELSIDVPGCVSMRIAVELT